MGAYLSEPQTDKETDTFNDTHFRVGSSSMQGWRKMQEDAHKIVLGFGQSKSDRIKADKLRMKDNLPPCAGLFTVMDGHGGGDVSAYASTRLEKVFSQLHCDEKSDDHIYQQIIMNLDADIRKYFTDLANANSTAEEGPQMQDLLEQEFSEAKKRDSQMTREKAAELIMKVLHHQKQKSPTQNLSDTMGCTCVTSLIIPREEKGVLTYFVKATNSGDSRVLVWNQETNTVHGTKDHKPNDPHEKARIEAAGGEVREMTAGGDRVQYRVNGNLNLCRALGDYEYKQRTDLTAPQQMITSCPDVYSWPCKEGDIVVLACDGIFDVLTNQQVIDFIRERIGKKDLGTICEECMMACLSEDPKTTHGIGGDNMTIVIIHLTGSRSPAIGKWPANDFVKPKEKTTESKES